MAKSERLQYQYAYEIDPKLAAGKTKAEVMAIVKRAKTHFLATGESIKGVKIIIRWRNPDNPNPRHANWKSSEDPDQSLYDVWETLGKGRGALGARR